MVKFKNAVHAISYAGAVVAGFAVVLMMFMICADVFMREFFQRPILFTTPIVQYLLMPISIFLSLPLTYEAGILPKIGSLDKLPRPLKIANETFIFIIELIGFAALTWFSVIYMRNCFAQKTGVDMGRFMGYTYPVTIVLPIGFLVTFIMVVLVRLKIGEKKKAETALAEEQGQQEAEKTE